MSEVVRLRTRVDIDEEAAVWAWRMDSTTITHAERVAHDAWLRQDPRNARAYKELTGVWLAMDALAEAKRDEKIATFAQPKTRSASRRIGWAVIAGVATCAALGVIWWMRGSELQTLSTAVGQQRNVTLADGSQITLNTNTIVESNLQRHVRDIYLRKGEAHFQVAHDSSRPFFVHAGDAVVRAVGTEFEVRVRADTHVDVVVSEGRVEVRAEAVRPVAEDDKPALRAVSAGQRFSTASSDYAVTPVSAEQLTSKLAWREGAVVFDGESLADAVAEVERYTDTRITIVDPAVAALRVGGRFRTGDMQAFFIALQAALPVSIRQTAAGVIIDHAE